MSAWMLSVFGYDADAAMQTSTATNGIKLLVSIIPGAIFIAAALLLSGYKLNKKMELEIEAALQQRRNKIQKPQTV